VSEDAAEIIVLDLADKGRLRAEARDTDDGVCRRPPELSTAGPIAA
jgi:hypothetical protein